MQLSLHLESAWSYTTWKELEAYYQHSAQNADKVRLLVVGMRELLSEDHVWSIDVELIFSNGDRKIAYAEHTLPSLGNRNSYIFKEWEILYDLVEHGNIRQKFHGHRFHCREIQELLCQMDEQAREIDTATGEYVYDEATANLVFDVISRFDDVMADLK